MILCKADRKFMLCKAMPFFGIKKVIIRFNDSQANWPDIWTTPPIITVTNEWAKQTESERQKRLTHELLHFKGLQHEKELGYSTLPKQDMYSKLVYKEVLKNG